MLKYLVADVKISFVMRDVKANRIEAAEHYISSLQAYYSEIQSMSDQKLAPLLPLLDVLLEKSHTCTRRLLEITGIRLMILAVKMEYSPFEKLVRHNYDEDYVDYVYSELVQIGKDDVYLIQFAPQLFFLPAEHARDKRKEQALMAIYKASFALDIRLHPDDYHPISYAAETEDLTFARAYIKFAYSTGQLHYDRSDGCSALIDVVCADQVGMMKLCLENNANVNALLPSGRSLLAAAESDEMWDLIRAYGGESTPAELVALYNTVDSVTASAVNIDSLEMLLHDRTRPFRHVYKNGFTVNSHVQGTDVIMAAGKQHNFSLLKRLLTRLEEELSAAPLEKVRSLGKVRHLLKTIEERPEAVANYLAASPLDLAGTEREYNAAV